MVTYINRHFQAVKSFCAILITDLFACSSAIRNSAKKNAEYTSKFAHFCMFLFLLETLVFVQLSTSVVYHFNIHVYLLLW